MASVKVHGFIFICHNNIIIGAGNVEEERLPLMAEFGSCSLGNDEITVSFSLPDPFIYHHNGYEDMVVKIYEIRLECTGQVSLQ